MRNLDLDMYLVLFVPVRDGFCILLENQGHFDAFLLGLFGQ